MIILVPKELIIDYSYKRMKKRGFLNERLVAEKYLQIAKLANDPANAEVVIDGILTFFGLDYFDLDLGVEYLYTTKVIDHKFRSVLHKAEDMDAIMAWFKEKAGVTDEEIAAAEAKEKEYVAGC